MYTLAPSIRSNGLREACEKPGTLIGRLPQRQKASRAAEEGVSQLPGKHQQNPASWQAETLVHAVWTTFSAGKSAEKH